MMYFFIFGNHPRLSLAELISVQPHLEILHAEDNLCLVKLHTKTDIAALQFRLGGTVKIGKILETLSRDEMIESKLVDLMNSHIQSALGKKISFGISLHAPLGNQTMSWFSHHHQRLGLQLKKKLRETETPVRFVTSKDSNDLSSVVVRKNHLLSEHGYEFVYLPAKTQWYLGQTLTVQPFEYYSQIDYGRPSRDAKSGLLPPKLAQIMINLTGANPSTSTLLDPFCGSGTILQQALLLGYKKIIGSDFGEKAIADSANNLAWLKTRTHLGNENYELFTADVQNISQKLEANTIDVVVTEPYMGPPIRGNESESELKNRVLKLSNLYVKGSSELHRLLTKKGRIVMVLPHFRAPGKKIAVQITNQLIKLGFMPLNPSISEYHLTPLLYSRPDQKIIREIIILEKK